jgi:3-oxoacyl-[acyl-carrier-protein] synthase II
MANARRAVITGAGVVSPLGIGVEEYWRGLQAGRSPVRRLDLFDTSHTSAKHAAWIADWDARHWLPPHKLKRMERWSQFAVVAALQAVRDAGLNPVPPGCGISLGTALGGFSYGESVHADFLQKGPSSVAPAFALQVYPATAQGQIAIELGCTGPVTTNTNSCAAGNSALGDALRMIQYGDADVVLAGAAEAPISPLVFKAFDNAGAMSSYDGPDPAKAYRPFHADRSGFVMGEGAVMFVVESLEHALERGAVVWGEILSYAVACEAFHMSSPAPSGEALRRCMTQALVRANLRPADITHISPHASGTRANDAHELAQISAIFGNCAGGIPISGTKPQTGHMLGAAGAAEALNCLLAIRNQWLPPTLSLDYADPALEGYDLIPKVGRPAAVGSVLNLSLGFSGIDTALVLAPV